MNTNEEKKVDRGVCAEPQKYNIKETIIVDNTQEVRDNNYIWFVEQLHDNNQETNEVRSELKNLKNRLEELQGNRKVLLGTVGLTIEKYSNERDNCYDKVNYLSNAQQEHERLLSINSNFVNEEANTATTKLNVIGTIQTINASIKKISADIDIEADNIAQWDKNIYRLEKLLPKEVKTEKKTISSRRKKK